MNEWFDRAGSHPIREDVVGLGRFGKVLTVLHCPKLSLAGDGYDDDDEDALIESWTPRFK